VLLVRLLLLLPLLSRGHSNHRHVGAEEFAVISSYQTLSGDKNWKSY
jgi:hypothetical protein